MLEVKLQLAGEQQTPSWVADLLETGLLVEVNKFGKFVHGLAALLPASRVRELPYWFHQVNLVDEDEEEAGGAKGGGQPQEELQVYKREKRARAPESAPLLPAHAHGPPEPGFLERVAKLFLALSKPTTFQKVATGKLVVEPKVRRARRRAPRPRPPGSPAPGARPPRPPAHARFSSPTSAPFWCGARSARSWARSRSASLRSPRTGRLWRVWA